VLETHRTNSPIAELGRDVGSWYPELRGNGPFPEVGTPVFVGDELVDVLVLEVCVLVGEVLPEAE
jgi:hypothetical protein